jgi:hypothetical protein
MIDPSIFSFCPFQLFDKNENLISSIYTNYRAPVAVERKGEKCTRKNRTETK